MAVIRSLSGEEARDAVPGLADLLIDCVHGAASVSFMAPLSEARAAAFWSTVADGVVAGDRVLLVAEAPGGALLGTVQLVLAQPENQPHRADLAKMLVASGARRQGIGEALMRAAEEAGRAAGKTLLVLDTVTGSPAARLYTRLGWREAGTIPNYALMPDGAPCATTYFYKAL
ncbi:MAG: GNAT family N-acetyltransferase [Rhodospirillales bacterium 69-11]|nr:GNAT family N-acetyltransferase [Rhodospirillales bacterium]OJW27733.1 MAG: GNAT family N-acetyltransferase [Rhodospirillales bacterium 69-11]